MPTPVLEQPAADADAPTRERMLDAALEAFSELGFDGASTRTIAARAGVNQGLIPYYFGSKEALWREAVDRAFAELGGEIREGLAEGSADDRDRSERLIRRFVRFVARKPAFVRLMSDEGKREGPRMRWIVDRHVRPMYDAMIRIMEDAGAATRLPPGIDALHLYYIVVGAITQLFHQAPECRRLTGRDPADEDVIESHTEALVALFVGEPTGRTPS